MCFEAGLHHTPYEGFVNAQMDLVRNYAESLNLHYRRRLRTGRARRSRLLAEHLAFDEYRQGQVHLPDAHVDADEHSWKRPGLLLQNEVPLSARHTLRVGNELHRFVLDDDWPAVAGTAPMMGPNTFVSINDGRRIRLGTFAELASKWNPQWSTLFGLRNDTVWTNAGPVQGYSGMMYGADAAAFNGSNRAHTDPDFDATALARYEPNTSSTYEFGYARKTRAPNLYERYAWSTNMDGQRHDRLVRRRQLLRRQRRPQAGDCPYGERHGNLARPDARSGRSSSRPT